ncbi:YbjN domain-containing protein [Ralstonia flatus]|uniref:YbjN domain-containing protein n=1 Tax=Ralstonia flatus TaxID=3058601 RepID=UPI00292ED34E|nr:YbjN domain-containing protein [Ralstonia sp. LMG 32965]
MTTMSMLTTLSPNDVSDAIKAAGGAVNAIEQGGITYLTSASHGISFQILWGNAIEPGHYADLTLSCPLRVQGGTLPEGLIADWHRSRRFARLAQHGDFVVLEMDVIAAGGISTEHLITQIRLWMQMMGEFFVYLRNYRDEPVTQAAPDAGVVQPTEAVTQ